MLNHIVIMGRLTRDPDLRCTQTGVNVASFTVAVERDYADPSRNRETDFIDCVAWRQTGEFVHNYFRKGQMIVVEGRLQSRKWQDREGNNRTAWEILVDHSYFGESKRENSGQGGYGTQAGGYGSDQYSGYQTSRSANAPPPGQVSSLQQGTSHQGFRELEGDDEELPF